MSMNTNVESRTQIDKLITIQELITIMMDILLGGKTERKIEEIMQLIREIRDELER